MLAANWRTRSRPTAGKRRSTAREWPSTLSPNQTRPTGFSGVPPSGPAIPVIATAMRALAEFAALADRVAARANREPRVDALLRAAQLERQHMIDALRGVRATKRNAR